MSQKSSKALGRLLLALLFGTGTGICQDSTQPYYSVQHPRALMMTGSSPDQAAVAPDALAYALTSVKCPVTLHQRLQPGRHCHVVAFRGVHSVRSGAYGENQQKAPADFVNGGGGFLALRDAIDGPPDGAYAKLIGGSLVRYSGPYHGRAAGRAKPGLRKRTHLARARGLGHHRIRTPRSCRTGAGLARADQLPVPGCLISMASELFGTLVATSNSGSTSSVTSIFITAPSNSATSLSLRP